MLHTATDPIHDHWSTDHRATVGPETTITTATTATTAVTAADVDERLARFEVADLADLAPHLAAAAAELASISAIAWCFSTDDAPVASIRMIARVTMRNPDAGGAHTARLFDQLV